MPEIEKQYNFGVVMTSFRKFIKNFWHKPQVFKSRIFDEVSVAVSTFRSRLHLKLCRRPNLSTKRLRAKSSHVIS